MSTIAKNQENPPSSQTSQLVLPNWTGDDKKVTWELDGNRKLWWLRMQEGRWTFVPHKEKTSVALSNFALIYQSFLDQQIILPGWHSTFLLVVAAAHVSALGLACNCPESL
eukprot:14083308-Ditylum_brightwellii.AAC.1